MKIRATAIIDFDVENYVDAAAEDQRIKQFLAQYVASNRNIVWSGVELKERRDTKK
ncbi:hypothetical protein NeNHUV3_10890 [Nereida sp. NH-UV-3]